MMRRRGLSISGPGRLALVLLAALVLCCAPIAAQAAEAKPQPKATPTVRAETRHKPARAEAAKKPAPKKTPAPRKIDWKAIDAQAAQLLTRYIRINTTNPPGNEYAAAQMLKEQFLADGIPATTWQPAPGRGVIAARLQGIGNHTRTIVLLSHMDVVPAVASQWKVPPFSGEIKNGEIWGRGAIDDKGSGVIEMMAMLAIKRAGILLDRDVLFLATGDEEAGGRMGAGWVVKHQPNLLRHAGYVLNEGGGIQALRNGKKIYAVSVSEKTPMWLKLTATGEPGHAAVPPENTAVTRLVRALDRLIDYRTPIRILDPVAGYFHARAILEGGPRGDLDLRASLRQAAFARRFLAEPYQNALVRDTITPTMLSGSDKTNVLPAVASAEVDCRLLPGENPKRFLRTIERVIDDRDVKVQVILNFPSVSSPRKTMLMAAIEKLARSEHATVVPTMIAGFTDSHYFRELGITAYGFMPIEVTREEARGVHGINERISEKSLDDGIKRMVTLLKILGGRE